MKIQRLEIFNVSFDTIYPQENIQQGMRYGVVLTNDVNNRYSPIVQVAPITSQTKKDLPTHVEIQVKTIKGIILVEQSRPMNKKQLIRKAATIKDLDKIIEIEKAIRIHFGLLN